jgi:IclR family transcriptional regulator, pca regulon regulatory protein
MRNIRRLRRPKGDFVASLDRGLRVLQAFGPTRAHLTLSEVAALTSLCPATARRALLTLHSLGYLKYANRRFSLSARVLRLSAGYIRMLHADNTLSA